MNGEKKSFSLSIATASLCLLPNILFADAFVTLESITLLEESSSGIGEEKIISKNTLERTQAKEMKDVFKNEASINVGGGARNAQRIYLRGIEGTNLNITIDGAKQGGSLFQHSGDIGGIDPALLKSVAVSTIAGADSGSGALGGSIVLETIDAQDMLQKGQNMGAIIRGGLYSASDGYSGGTSIYGRINDYSGLIFDISGVNQEDYRTGNGGDALNSAVEDKNYFLKYSLLNFKDNSLKIGFMHNENDGYYLGGGQGSDMGVPDPSKDASHIISTRDTYTIDHRYNPNNHLIDLKTNFYYNKRNYENKTSDTDVTSKNIGGNIKNTMTFETGNFYHLYTLGGDYNVEDGITKSASTNTSETLGLFLQGSTNYNIVTLNYGLRLDEYNVDYGTNKSFNGNEISPNFGLNIEIIEGLNAFANYSESIKIGSIIPIQWLSNTRPDTLYNGSINGYIKPETSKQMEGGLKYNLKSAFINGDDFSIGGTIFKTTISDLIEKSGKQWRIDAIYNNPLDVISKGYELKASWKLESFKTSLSFLHVNTKDADGNIIIAERRTASSVGDTLKFDNIWAINPQIQIEYTLTSVSAIDDLPSTSTQRKGYILHDIQAQYKPKSLKNLTINLAVNNMFDKEYYAQTSFEGADGSFVEECGRDIRLSFKYIF